MLLFSALFISMFITIALVPVLKSLSGRIGMLDLPDERKVHDKPMPKTGGVAMAAGILVPFFMWADKDPFFWGLTAGTGLILIMGMVDDIRPLSYASKFLVQAAAAVAVIWIADVSIVRLGDLGPDGYMLPRWAGSILAFFAILGVTNAINLSDGLDGLAGGIAMLGFLAITYLSYQTGQWVSTLLSISIVGATFGFLRYNTYPATVFMGDTGSQLLGFLSITLALKVTQASPVLSPLLPLFLMGVPVLDTLAVMVERYMRGRNIFEADRNHLHHKLLRRGFYHTEAVLMIYAVQAVLTFFAVIFRYGSERFLLLCYCLFSVAVVASFTIAERRGLRLHRRGFFDLRIKGGLKKIKELHLHIRIPFMAAQILFPFILFLDIFFAVSIPVYLYWMAGIGLAAAASAFFFKKNIFIGFSRAVYYLLIPFLIYFSEINFFSKLPQLYNKIYSATYGILALLVIITIKFTRRESGFKTSTFDFLIILIAVLIPSLPIPVLETYRLGMMATKMMILFFSYEVITLEMRKEHEKKILAGHLIFFSLICLKGMVI